MSRKERSFSHRNFVGGFVGGSLGIFAMSWAGTVLMLFACLSGFFVGFYYDRLFTLACNVSRRSAPPEKRLPISEQVKRAHWLSSAMIFTPLAALAICFFAATVGLAELPLLVVAIGVLIDASFVFVLSLRENPNWNKLPSWYAPDCYRLSWEQAIDLQRCTQFEQMGFWKYTLERAWKMFTLSVVGFVTVVPALLLVIGTAIIYALLCVVPVQFAYDFCRRLPSVSTGKHWIGMGTTLLVTCVSALLFNELAGVMLVALAFGTGLVAGGLSMLTCELIARITARFPSLVGWAHGGIYQYIPHTESMAEKIYAFLQKTLIRGLNILGDPDDNYGLL